MLLTSQAGAKQPGTLPDIARELLAATPGTLDKVGMAGIDVPIRVRDPFGCSFKVPAVADAFVSLDDPNAKGIHMSRLFLAVQQTFANTDFSFGMLEGLLKRFVESQKETSRSSYLRLAFDLLVERRALLSEHGGWRKYPIVIEAGLVHGVTSLAISIEITYSSTCPCSAALARQLIQKQFEADFAGETNIDFRRVLDWLGTEEAICATPHSQRSHARIDLRFESFNSAPALIGMVNDLENAVGTPVQAAVKRKDEQEFARLNGGNLMFAEDAARRLKVALESMTGISDYRLRVDHLESLHPHDAVAIAVKGVPGGFQP
jgi:GTP cyclohydrolase I